MNRTFADLFAVPPQTWGARGDPYLWEDIRLHAINNKTPLPTSVGCLVEQLYILFEDFTGHSVNEREWFYVEKYAHGGMSSGHVEPSGWREGGKILDYIQQNFIRIAMVDEHL
jgi:molybdenum cofactor cytidylyltransferase